MTLMTFGNSEGKRRCDARSYDATSPKCNCICGGVNHGVGQSKAMQQTAGAAEGMIQKLKYEYPGKILILNVTKNLFDETEVLNHAQS